MMLPRQVKFYNNNVNKKFYKRDFVRTIENTRTLMLNGITNACSRKYFATMYQMENRRGAFWALS